MISVVVFDETTNSVATVRGLSPLLHQQEFSSRPKVEQVVAADAVSSTMISVVVFDETTNSVATVRGLSPLLHQQEFSSRPQGRAGSRGRRSQQHDDQCGGF